MDTGGGGGGGGNVSNNPAVNLLNAMETQVKRAVMSSVKKRGWLMTQGAGSTWRRPQSYKRFWVLKAGGWAEFYKDIAGVTSEQKPVAVLDLYNASVGLLTSTPTSSSSVSLSRRASAGLTGGAASNSASPLTGSSPSTSAPASPSSVGMKVSPPTATAPNTALLSSSLSSSASAASSSRGSGTVSTSVSIENLASVVGKDREISTTRDKTSFSDNASNGGGGGGGNDDQFPATQQSQSQSQPHTHFFLHTIHKDYRLQASTEEEALSWIKAIREEIAQANMQREAERSSKSMVVISRPTSVQYTETAIDHAGTVFWKPEQFAIQEKIGSGAYGSVYRAKMAQTGFECAIKAIDAGKGQDFLQSEYEFLKGCVHPNIVQYYGCCLKDNELWILMEFCGVGSVLDVMECLDRPLQEPCISIILKSVLEGLRYLHEEKNMIHRDVKSANILLTNSGDVKIADFGIATQYNNKFACVVKQLGTPHWMAPEVWAEERHAFPADIWSFGITAYEMAYGMPPHNEIGPLSVYMKITRDPPPRLPANGTIAPDSKTKLQFTETFREFIGRVLVKDPHSRPSARELLQDAFVSVISLSANSLLQQLIVDFKKKHMEEMAEKARKRLAKKAISSPKQGEDVASSNAASGSGGGGGGAAAGSGGSSGSGGSHSDKRQREGSGKEPNTENRNKAKAVVMKDKQQLPKSSEAPGGAGSKDSGTVVINREASNRSNSSKSNHSNNDTMVINNSRNDSVVINSTMQVNDDKGGKKHNMPSFVMGAVAAEKGYKPPPAAATPAPTTPKDVGGGGEIIVSVSPDGADDDDYDDNLVAAENKKRAAEKVLQEQQEKQQKCLYLYNRLPPADQHLLCLTDGDSSGMLGLDLTSSASANQQNGNNSATTASSNSSSQHGLVFLNGIESALVGSATPESTDANFIDWKTVAQLWKDAFDQERSARLKLEDKLRDRKMAAGGTTNSSAAMETDRSYDEMSDDDDEGGDGGGGGGGNRANGMAPSNLKRNFVSPPAVPPPAGSKHSSLASAGSASSPGAGSASPTGHDNAQAGYAKQTPAQFEIFLRRDNVGVVYFQQYLKEEELISNYQFWLEADQFAHMGSNNLDLLRQKAYIICCRFFSPGIASKVPMQTSSGGSIVGVSKDNATGEGAFASTSRRAIKNTPVVGLPEKLQYAVIKCLDGTSQIDATIFKECQKVILYNLQGTYPGFLASDHSSQWKKISNNWEEKKPYDEGLLTVPMDVNAKKLDLEDILNRKNVAIVYLQRFVQSIGAPHNLLFWMQSQKYEKLFEGQTPPFSSAVMDSARQTAYEIYDSFIAENAPRRIPLTAEQRNAIREGLAEGDLSTTLFKSAQTDIFKYMRDLTFPRFLASDFFREYQQNYLLQQEKEGGGGGAGAGGAHSSPSTTGMPPTIVPSGNNNNNLNNNNNSELQFQRLFLNRKSQGLIHFKRFCEQEHSVENLLFWLDVQKFRSDAAHLSSGAARIYELYIRADAPNCVKLGQSDRQKVRDGLERISPSAFELFTMPQQDVFASMFTDCYRRFLQSKEFKDFTKTAQQRKPGDATGGAEVVTGLALPRSRSHEEL